MVLDFTKVYHQFWTWNLILLLLHDLLPKTCSLYRSKVPQPGLSAFILKTSNARHPSSWISLSLSLSLNGCLSRAAVAAEADGERTESERVSESARTADPDGQAVRG